MFENERCEFFETREGTLKFDTTSLRELVFLTLHS
jgi:hypothetical protein